MKVSATKAGKLSGVTTPTITRAIERGDISAEKKPKGGYLIDMSEVDRFKENRKAIYNDTDDILQSNTQSDNNALQAEVEGLRERLADKDATIDDLRTRLDREGEERRQMTAVLTDMREKPAEPPKRGFWARWRP